MIITNEENPVLSELTHYGILGMHWGHRKREDRSNSQVSSKKEPKKLSPETIAKREAKAVKFEQKAKDALTEKDRAIYLREAQRAREGKLSRRQRQLIAAMAFVAAYATYKLIDSGAMRQKIEQGKAFVQKKSGISPWKVNDTLKDQNLSAFEIRDRVASRINPGYGKPGTTNNCRRCTFAYEMSRRGFDVIATKTIGGTGQNEIGLFNTSSTHTKKAVNGMVPGLISYFKNKEYQKFVNDGLKNTVTIKNQKESVNEIFSSLSKMPSGSRGELEVGWSALVKHSMAWEIVDKKPVIFDTQSNKVYDTVESMSDFSDYIKTFRSTRLDNVSLDDDFLRRWLKNG